MNVKLSPVHVTEKPVLERLMELYLYDFTEFQDFDMNGDGWFRYDALDRYWEEEGRYPFFIKVDGKLAGFALVAHQLGESGDSYYYMAEFFVMKKFRRGGVGREAAYEAFNLFPGPWVITQVAANKPAQNFWHQIIDRYTTGDFETGVKPSGLVYQKFMAKLGVE